MNQTATQDGAQSESQIRSSAVFGIGDRVTWTHCRSNGNQIGFSTRQGKIINTMKAAAFVKQRNGKTEWVRFDRLTKEGETTELTKMFMVEHGESSKPMPNKV